MIMVMLAFYLFIFKAHDFLPLVHPNVLQHLSKDVKYGGHRYCK
ncbi:hypothetical protein M20_0620 [Lactococcus lactis subsp. lactis]|uniref:Uncharacterized protein n=1 Tax=Lactococcus lactis subsp. lactis TaxID=1360 RepID=A0A0V8E925_LACLL|nr:hypothetical protein M20_0620 [Lactococcus lactis subsp. lactis]